MPSITVLAMRTRTETLCGRSRQCRDVLPSFYTCRIFNRSTIQSLVNLGSLLVGHSRLHPTGRYGQHRESHQVGSHGTSIFFFFPLLGTTKISSPETRLRLPHARDFHHQTMIRRSRFAVQMQIVNFEQLGGGYQSSLADYLFVGCQDPYGLGYPFRDALSSLAIATLTNTKETSEVPKGKQRYLV